MGWKYERGQFDNKIWPSKCLKWFETEILQTEQNSGFVLYHHRCWLCLVGWLCNISSYIGHRNLELLHLPAFPLSFHIATGNWDKRWKHKILSTNRMAACFTIFCRQALCCRKHVVIWFLPEFSLGTLLPKGDNLRSSRETVIKQMIWVTTFLDFWPLGLLVRFTLGYWMTWCWVMDDAL